MTKKPEQLTCGNISGGSDVQFEKFAVPIKFYNGRKESIF